MMYASKTLFYKKKNYEILQHERGIPRIYEIRLVYFDCEDCTNKLKQNKRKGTPIKNKS